MSMLPRRCVFVASPSDVSEARRHVGDVHNLISQTAKLDFERPYLWEFERVFETSEISILTQDAIPRPTDPNCVGVVCLLGERIGSPIGDPAPLLDDVLWATEPKTTGGARLEPNWTDSAIDDGGFPLTGSTYEFLATLGHNRRARDGADPRVKPIPLRLILCADETILKESNPVDANWGWSALLKKKEQQLAQRTITRTEFDTWRDTEYYTQIRMLGNFIRFLKEWSYYPDKNRDIAYSVADVGRHFRDFYEKSLGVFLADQQIDPFKGLDVFEIDDYSVFSGRDQEVETARSKLWSLYSASARPTLLGVTGGSGVGKSSFLRAGMLGALLRRDHRGAAVSAAELIAQAREAATPQEAATRALANILAAAQHAAPNAAREGADDVEAIYKDLSRFTVAAQIDEAAAQLERTVSRFVDIQWRFVLAVDQIEELTRALSRDASGSDEGAEERNAAEAARALFGFIRKAARIDRIAIAYAIVDRDLDALREGDALGADFSDSELMKLEALSVESLVQVAERSFRSVRITLEPALQNAIRVSLERLVEEERSRDGASLLPLFATLLRRIHREKKEAIDAFFHKSSEKRNSNTDETRQFRLATETDELFTLTLEACAPLLSIETAINDLFDQAVSASGKRARTEWSPSDEGDNVLDKLLLRLVAVRRRYGSDFEPELVEAALDDEEDAMLPIFIDELSTRRLIVEGSTAGKLRFVHIAVVKHWEYASTWLTRKREIFRDRLVLANRLLECDDDARKAAYFQSVSSADLEQAARVLIEFYTSFSSANPTEEDQALRDFALDMVRAHPDSGGVIVETQSGMRQPIMHIVANYDDAPLLSAVIERQPDLVDSQRSDGRSVLFPLAFRDAAAEAAQCLDASADKRALVKLVDKKGWLATHAAARAGALETFETLVAAGADPTATGPGGQDALHLAAMNGHAAACRRMIEVYGLDPLRANTHRRTAAHLASANNHVATLDAIASSQGVIDEIKAITEPTSPFQDAIAANSVAAARWLLGHGCGDPEAVDGANDRPLHAAAMNGRIEAVRFLVDEARVDASAAAVNRDRATPLHIAIVFGRDEVANFLLSAEGVDVNQAQRRGATPLYLAIETNRLALIDRLMREPDIDVAAADASGRSPLRIAFDRGDRRLMLQLMTRPPADLNRRQLGGWTPLLLAAGLLPHERLFDLLERPDTALDDVADDGSTLLSCIIGNGAVDTREAVERLMENPKSETAAQAWSSSLARLLAADVELFLSTLKHKQFDLNAPGRNGVRPIHIAAMKGEMSVVAALSERGDVDMNVEDGWGRTALDFAPESVRDAVAAYMRKDVLLTGPSSPGRRLRGPVEDAQIAEIDASAPPGPSSPQPSDMTAAADAAPPQPEPEPPRDATNGSQEPTPQKKGRGFWSWIKD